MVPRALVLASASPQRRALLEQLGITFTVVPSVVEELGEGDPEAVARENALRKARAVAQQLSGDGSAARPVLGVDTLVALGGEIFGKPADAQQARAMLTRLRGRTHDVWSGIVLATPTTTLAETVRTAVRFAAVNSDEIDAYVATNEWQGRAGGYAIQGAGAWLVEGVEGDYSNVVGLPIAALRRLLSQLSTST